MKKYITAVLKLPVRIVFITFLLISLMPITDSCKNINTTEKSIILLNLDRTESQIIDFNDILTLEKVVVLEETMDSYISHIIKIDTYNSEIYILDNRYAAVYRFDSDGKFLNQIGSEGSGPGELIRTSTFCIDKDIIYFLDKSKILKYTLDGEFIEDYNRPYYTFDFTHNKGKYWLYNINTPHYDQIIVLDSLFESKRLFSPLRHSPFVLPQYGRDYLMSDNEYDYLTYPYSDTIYKLLDTIAIPIISFGFGERKFNEFQALFLGTWDGDLSKIDYSFRDYFTNDHLICKLVIDYSSMLNIYNFKNNESLLIESFSNGPDLINGASLLDVDSEGLFCWGYSSEKKEENIDDILQNTELNDNTVLIFTRLKK